MKAAHFDESLRESRVIPEEVSGRVLSLRERERVRGMPWKYCSFQLAIVETHFGREDQLREGLLEAFGERTECAIAVLQAKYGCSNRN